jgi:hypothetical protein
MVPADGSIQSPHSTDLQPDQEITFVHARVARRVVEAGVFPGKTCEAAQGIAQTVLLPCRMAPVLKLSPWLFWRR